MKEKERKERKKGKKGKKERESKRNIEGEKKRIRQKHWKTSVF